MFGFLLFSSEIVFLASIETLFRSGWHFFVGCVGCWEVCGFLL